MKKGEDVIEEFQMETKSGILTMRSTYEILETKATGETVSKRLTNTEVVGEGWLTEEMAEEFMTWLNSMCMKEEPSWI